MNTIFLIPARGGSKGVPGKNIKPLCRIPLVYFSIDMAREFAKDDDICLSTDDNNIIQMVRKDKKLNIPFVRPPELATDNAGTYEVLIHGIDFFENKNKIKYDVLVLLQPTSPFRTKNDVKNALALFEKANHDMVVSVVESKANPYFTLFEENEKGFLQQSKKSNFTRRQDCPKVYEYNGAIYIINIDSLKKMKINEFTRIKKSLMDKENSLDIDTPFDWEIAEYFMKKRNQG
jgi:CMP-N,N'-diacetyllegionaminic acid synthase